jgi:hypothetical protein
MLHAMPLPDHLQKRQQQVLQDQLQQQSATMQLLCAANSRYIAELEEARSAAAKADAERQNWMECQAMWVREMNTLRQENDMLNVRMAQLEKDADAAIEAEVERRIQKKNGEALAAIEAEAQRRIQKQKDEEAAIEAEAQSRMKKKKDEEAAAAFETAVAARLAALLGNTA